MLKSCLKDSTKPNLIFVKGSDLEAVDYDLIRDAKLFLDQRESRIQETFGVKYLSAPRGKMTTLSRGGGPGALELQHTQTQRWT